MLFRSQIINVGSNPNDSTGDPIRTSFQKVNANFNEIYSNLIGSNFKLNVNTMTTTSGDITISPYNGNPVTIGSSNKLIVANMATSTSETTGALTVAGGVGIVKSLTVGTNISVLGSFYTNSLSIAGTADSTSPTTGAFVSPGGIGVADRKSTRLNSVTSLSRMPSSA